MEASTIWWLAAGAVVVAELLTGTFYLLMVALGLVAAALAAHIDDALIRRGVAGEALPGNEVQVRGVVHARGHALLEAQPPVLG